METECLGTWGVTPTSCQYCSFGNISFSLKCIVSCHFSDIILYSLMNNSQLMRSYWKNDFITKDCGVSDIMCINKLLRHIFCCPWRTQCSVINIIISALNSTVKMTPPSILQSDMHVAFDNGLSILLKRLQQKILSIDIVHETICKHNIHVSSRMFSILFHYT